MIVPLAAQDAADVADHYDELDPFYREVWGEHVHHGYWASGRETPEEAVEALVDLVAKHLALEPGLQVCDVGCGYGASARRLAGRHGVAVTGVTVSPVQAAFAQGAIGSAADIRILCRDWLANGFPDAGFDRVMAVESSEHMVDKARFFAEAFRTLRPGGRMVVCAWLARAGAGPWEVRHLLEPICREGRLPSMGTEGEYRQLATEAGFEVARCLDLSRQVSRTWAICARRVALKLATVPGYRRFLLDRGARNRIFALTIPRLMLAYRTGAMRYGLLVAVKPGGGE